MLQTVMRPFHRQARGIAEPAAPSMIRTHPPAGADAGDDRQDISYIRPGLLKVVSAGDYTDGLITARVKATHPKGIPLDMDGVNTPGPISIRLIAAYIPAGGTQYVSYTTTLPRRR